MEALYSAGIDVGGSSTKLALVSEEGRFLSEARLPSVAREPVAALFGRVRSTLEGMSAEAGLAYPPPLGAGAGMPAIVDHRTGWMKLAGTLELDACDVRGAAEAALNCPVAVECDSNAGLLADLYWGAARDASNVLYVSWGTGIGAGLALKRRLYRSAGGSMGEFGHTPVEFEKPRQCYCGCHGCLESEAGGRALETLAGGASVEEIASAAAAGDVSAARLLERAARLMARALAGGLVLLNPDCVVFGGGVSACMPLMRTPFEEELALRAPPFARRAVKIAVSEFGGRAGVLGAAMLPRHQKEGQDGYRYDGD